MKDDEHNRGAPGPGISTRPFEEIIRRAMLSKDPAGTDRMKRFSTAAALVIAGRPGCEMHAPEPLVQVGFELDEAEMDMMVADAVGLGRDLIHVSCHSDGSGMPTGMIATVYLEDGKPRAHRRGGLLCAPGRAEVLLSGVSDVEDEPCHFVLAPRRKMERVRGYPVPDLAAGMKRGGEKWLALERAGGLGDCSGERLKVYGLTDRTAASG